MTIESIVAAARDSRDWEPLVALVPYARFLGVRLDIRGDQFGACMPFDKKLIGNPALPALHGGVSWLTPSRSRYARRSASGIQAP